MGQLYFGDNLDILREHIPAESVDLIYLDPPFNSKRGYNLCCAARSVALNLSGHRLSATTTLW